ncbi:hypothetical protein AB0I10_22095 [Streptomyces sp. NPDC050636]|uniref:hypothetical protein n=1 Tax=Streptomyces sp. NPDC050636 TaxID=3154510 RepID=UPI0034483625
MAKYLGWRPAQSLELMGWTSSCWPRDGARLAVAVVPPGPCVPALGEGDPSGVVTLLEKVGTVRLAAERETHAGARHRSVSQARGRLL